MRSLNAPAYIEQRLNVTKKAKRFLESISFMEHFSLSANSHGFWGGFNSRDPNDLGPVAYSDG